MRLFGCFLAGSLLVACGDKDAPPTGSGSDNAARGASPAVAELDGVLKQKCSEACCGSDSKAASVCLKECKTDFWLDLDEGYKATVDLSADCPGQFVITSSQERRYSTDPDPGSVDVTLVLEPDGGFLATQNECSGITEVKGSWVESPGTVTLTPSKGRGLWLDEGDLGDPDYEPTEPTWSRWGRIRDVSPIVLSVVSVDELKLKSGRMGECGPREGDALRGLSGATARSKQ